MNGPVRNGGALAPAVELAIRAIAPSWPLDRQIAVNPWWGFIDRPFAQAAATLRRLTGTRCTLAPDEYLRAWRAGDITATALARALAENGSLQTPEHAVAALQTSPGAEHGLPLLSDVLDQRAEAGAGPRWRDTITQQVSQYCASCFDEHQADWHRGRSAGFFAGWRSNLAVDHALEPLMHAPEIRARVQGIPEAADAAISWSLERLGVPPEEAAVLLQVCLLRVNGWASWCAYLAWQAGLAGATDSHLRELLAIRVSWEALLHDGERGATAYGSLWRQRWTQSLGSEPAPRDAVELIWQRAHELSHQDSLLGLLGAERPEAAAQASGPASCAQLVFCIDVRSERLRRALECADPALQTHGFAGFFGLPIRYTPLGALRSRPQLPGLLAPTLEATDSTGDVAGDAAIARVRVRDRETKALWQPFLRTPSGAFALVETLGIGFVAAMLGRHFGLVATTALESAGPVAAGAASLQPVLRLADGDVGAQTAERLAAILRAMSLTSGFARLLVFVGHGSQSANNPQAAALDCGACGGHSGEINARILAGLINDTSVREGLTKRGIQIPATTFAVAALHNTTTDEVQLFDVDELPASHTPDLARLRRSLVQAGHATRAERAPALGLATQHPQMLLQQLRRRARDWAQTRPEWGLAGNAAFIVAPRSRTRGLNLAGRAFLHDYRPDDDQDGTVLELIMTAPLVVAHWINLQYYAATVDPERFGSGNKVLHNVACGRIGVFEGNTGDLRIGLSRQSVHDGERWMHAPLRLAVFIDAPRDRIETILAQHATVRQLVDNQWLYLFRFAAGGIERRREGRWSAAAT